VRGLEKKKSWGGDFVGEVGLELEGGEGRGFSLAGWEVRMSKTSERRCAHRLTTSENRCLLTGVSCGACRTASFIGSAHPLVRGGRRLNR
jgi:hypothetical protein